MTDRQGSKGKLWHGCMPCVCFAICHLRCCRIAILPICGVAVLQYCRVVLPYCILTICHACALLPRRTSRAMQLWPQFCTRPHATLCAWKFISSSLLKSNAKVPWAETVIHIHAEDGNQSGKHRNVIICGNLVHLCKCHYILEKSIKTGWPSCHHQARKRPKKEPGEEKVWFTLSRTAWHDSKIAWWNITRNLTHQFPGTMM